LNYPTGVASDGAGGAWITDTFNHAVRWVDAQGQIHAIDLEGGESLDTPASVAVGLGGGIYVADLGHNRVVRLTRAVSPPAITDPPAETAPIVSPDPAPALPPTGLQHPLSILHGATLKPEPISPGQLVAIQSSDLVDPSVSVRMNGQPVVMTLRQGELAYLVAPAEPRATLRVELVSTGTLVASAEAAMLSRVPRLFQDTGGRVVARVEGSPVLRLWRGAEVSLFVTGAGDALEGYELSLGRTPLVVRNAVRVQAGVVELRMTIPYQAASGVQKVLLTAGGTTGDPDAWAEVVD
jgi:hypothetical protein